jgi:hypothetical protein
VTMKCVYMIQGRSLEVGPLLCEVPHGATASVLTWDAPPPDGLNSPTTRTTYAPGTTWAEGRNFQLQDALQVGSFDYFVFLDADVRFESGSLSVFESLLRTYGPDIGIPLDQIIVESGRFDSAARVQTPQAMDQAVQAYSLKAVADGIAVPYVTDLDSMSWWYSCEINQFLSLTHYSKTTLQFNEVITRNTGHHQDSKATRLEGSGYRGGLTRTGMKLARNLVEDRYGIPATSLSLPPRQTRVLTKRLVGSTRRFASRTWGNS